MLRKRKGGDATVVVSAEGLAALRRLRRALSAPPLESRLEAGAVAYADSFGCLHFKMNGGGRRAKTDHLFVLPNGWVWWVEFKRTGEGARTDQRRAHRELRRRHQTVDVLDDLSRFKSRLHALLAKHTGGSALL